MKKFEKIVSRAVTLPREDIDTDQIIPARFLRTTERKGFGDNLFSDWRYDGEGRRRPDFVLNRPEAPGARILIAGRNFGCGSSREHAVWALQDYGIDAVIAPGFADIFRKNALGNGLLLIPVDAPVYEACVKAAEAGAHFMIDLETQTVSVPDTLSFTFEIDPFVRTCMLAGVDDLEYILQHRDAIDRFEAGR